MGSKQRVKNLGIEDKMDLMEYTSSNGNGGANANGFKKPKKFMKVGVNNITLTDRQREFQDKIFNNTITFCSGPAGTSKTFVACYTALQLLNRGDVSRVILTKPIEESGTKIGLLPGTVEEKVDPYLASYYETFKKLMNPSDFKTLITDKFIEFKPTAYMRGVTFDNCLMICDEAQNFDSRELMLFISRLGSNSKIIVMGDSSQHDINPDQMGLLVMMNILSGIKGVKTHEFTSIDIVRNPILVEITERYEVHKAQNSLGRMKRY